jgi:hypothetical protein
VPVTRTCEVGATVASLLKSGNHSNYSEHGNQNNIRNYSNHINNSDHRGLSTANTF